MQQSFKNDPDKKKLKFEYFIEPETRAPSGWGKYRLFYDVPDVPIWSDEQVVEFMEPRATILLDAFEKMIPKLKYRHRHDPQHVPEHILSSLIGTSLTVPVRDSKLMLGTWQKIILVDFSGPRERTIVASFVELKVR